MEHCSNNWHSVVITMSVDCIDDCYFIFDTKLSNRIRYGNKTSESNCVLFSNVSPRQLLNSSFSCTLCISKVSSLIHPFNRKKQIVINHTTLNSSSLISHKTSILSLSLYPKHPLFTNLVLRKKNKI